MRPCRYCYFVVFSLISIPEYWAHTRYGVLHTPTPLVLPLCSLCVCSVREYFLRVLVPARTRIVESEIRNFITPLRLGRSLDEAIADGVTRWGSRLGRQLDR